MSIPVGLGPAHTQDPFRGVIDLIDMQLLEFRTLERGGEVIRSEVPGELLDEALAWRDSMLETLYGYSNEMMELALEERDIPADLIRRVIRDATLHMQIQPVLCGAALHGLGVQPILDAVGWYLPSPGDRPPVEGVDPQDPEKRICRKPSLDEPFCGLVFKILPAKTGDLYWIRVYSGTLKANSRVLNPQRDKKENVAQLWQIHATRKERDGQVDHVTTGDIVGLIGPRHSITGDTLCDAQQPIVLPSIQFAETVLSMAIEPESTAERKKLGETLDMLKRQDPTFHAVENEETGQTIISGMGELHLEVIKHRLLRDFNLDVKVHKPRVSYRETIDHAAAVTGECHRQMGGRQLFARLQVSFEPAPQAKQQVQVLSFVDPEVVPPELVAAAVDELKLCGEGGGPIGSFPLAGIKVTVTGGEANAENSDEVAFRIAAADAFEKGMQAGGPVLLEPVMRLNITTPEAYLGEIVGDLQQRRAVICRTENRGFDVAVEAHAPLRELFGYANAIRSLSQGRAGCSMEPLALCPGAARTSRSSMRCSERASSRADEREASPKKFREFSRELGVDAIHVELYTRWFPAGRSLRREAYLTRRTVVVSGSAAAGSENSLDPEGDSTWQVSTKSFASGWRPTITEFWIKVPWISWTLPSGPIPKSTVRFLCRRGSSGTRCCPARTSTRKRGSSLRFGRTSV